MQFFMQIGEIGTSCKILHAFNPQKRSISYLKKTMNLKTNMEKSLPFEHQIE